MRRSLPTQGINMDTKDKLSTATILLHWVVGVFMIYMLVSGLLMEDLEIDWLFDSHTSIGVLIVLFVVPRLAWRYMNGWPEAVADYSKFEKISGKFVHWVLLIATFLMPLSGSMMAIGGGHGLHIFSLELVASVPETASSDALHVAYPWMEQLGGKIHFLVGANLLPIALILHVLGALKHHIIDKDKTLTRMFFNR